MVHLFEIFFEFQKEIHQKIFSWISFSFGDLFYIALGILFLYLIIKSFKKKKRPKSLVQILIIINIFYFTYQVFWGMLYFQTPIISKFQKTEVTVEKRKKLALIYLLKCKKTRKKVPENKNGIFTVSSLDRLQKEIIYQQNQLPVFISNKKNTDISDFKSSLFKEVMSYSGILGYYNPFTGSTV